MKLRALYSNDQRRFPRIDFREGLNVVFARVHDPTVHSKDSHNLGKTFLIRVLDFVLLGGCTGKHIFKTRDDLFADFVFYLEMKVESGAYVTIRRPVSGRAAIHIHVSKHPGGELTELPLRQWRHRKLGVAKAIDVLNRILNLTQVAPYGYRKGLGYVLRDQGDYTDEFQISRFGKGRDIDWKPFVASLLGFDHALLEEKYNKDRQQREKRAELRELERSGQGTTQEIDDLRGVIGVRERALERLRSQVAAFDFADIESAITRHTVRNVEQRIAELNERRFILERESHEIDRALKTDFGFDLRGITDAFEEAQKALPDLLVKSYEDLVAFNERISADRRTRLAGRRAELRIQIVAMDDELALLNDQRVEALDIITQRQTLRKFKAVQNDLLRKEERLLQLRQQLRDLGEAGRIASDLRRIEGEQLTLITKIDEMVGIGNRQYAVIRRLFSEFAHEVLGVSAVLATHVNSRGNLEFRTRILDDGNMGRETAETEGTSYRKALCVCMDLALLVAKARGGFYRFVYHDGVFEGFDNRRKVSLLRIVRRLCSEYGFQYILTVIDADLPRDEKDNRLLFTENDIVRELHDQGRAGRLFCMEPF